MNHVYRVIFNRVLGVWQAVTEIAKSQGKIGGAVKRHARKLAAIAAMTTGAGAAAQPAPNQLPQGGQVAAGNITIQQSGAQMQVNQATQKGIVNWQSFDVGSNASVHFNQPNADAATLNRVNSVTASQIHGQLSAVGKVFLLNSNGVIFGPSARVNVGSLVAGTMKITDQDFLAGNYKFTEGKGVITNMGELTAEEGGLIALLAPQVINEGIIRARKGTIVLAAGEAITLTNLSSNVTVVVEKPALDALVENKHLVSAPDGRVFMSAMAAHSLAKAVISNTGTIEATGAKRVGNVIRFEGSTVINAGVIDASNNTAANATDSNSPNPNSPQGSDITITAKNVKNTGAIKSNGKSGGKITIAAQETITNQGKIEAKGSVTATATTTTSTAVTTTAGTTAALTKEAAGKGGEIVLTANNVVNEGEINASGQIGGQVTITASQIVNEGLLYANGDIGGQISLTASQIINEGQINADGQLGGQITLIADDITFGEDAEISARSLGEGFLDPASWAQTVAQGDQAAVTASEIPVEILLEMADYELPRITIEAKHEVYLTGKFDVSSLNYEGGILTIKADAAQFIDIELTAASSVATGGLIEIESNTTYLDNGLIDVSGAVKAGQVFMSAPQPEVPAMPTAPPEPVPVPAPNPSSLLIQNTSITATSRRGHGGNVTLTADTIDLTKTQIIATGDTAGGNIKIGGDWQGQGNLPQAVTVSIDKDSTLDASAITNGDGGTIVAWSDISNPDSRTIVQGTLISEGGKQGGDGGKIETSGYDLMVDGITISTKANEAAGGRTGQWLLDPRNITISGGTDSGTTNYTATADSAVINVTTLTNALANSNVMVFTGTTGNQAGNITVDAAITSSSQYTLELKAANDIIINQDITLSNTGGLRLWAGYGAGSGNVSGSGDLLLSGGTTLTLFRGTTVSNNIDIGTGGATIELAVQKADVVDYLIVGGGGAGGFGTGGGGGAGGLLQGSALQLTGVAHTIGVGAGGAKVANNRGGDGGNSTAFGLTAVGGGGGGSNFGGNQAGRAGGSGGGSSHNGAGGVATAGQGFAGGSSGTVDRNYPSGGGGGAGGVGTRPANSSANGGAGGIGIQSSIKGTATYYAGGGGGGIFANGVGGAGGQGGGGLGAGANPASNASAGVDGLGGGGGGSSRNEDRAGRGGSGVVVVRYAGYEAATGGEITSYVGDGTNGEAGVTYTVHRFTAVGNSSFSLTQFASSSASITGVISGSGNLTFNAGIGEIELAASNTFTGATTIAGGTVKVSNANGLGIGSAVTLNNTAGAKLEIVNSHASPTTNPLTVSIGSLSGGGADGGNVTIGANATLATGNGSNTSFAGVISGAGSLKKTGAGTLTLTGTNTYAGTTTISAGTLQVGNNTATGTFGTGNISIASGATLAVERTDTFSLSQDIDGDGKLVQKGTGSLRLSGDSTYTGGTDLDAGTILAQSDTAMGTGTLTIAGSTTLLLGHQVEVANNISLAGAATIGMFFDVEYLIVGGGGGGGGSWNGGGGGAGGVLTGTAFVSSSSSVVVGAGGSGAHNATTAGGNSQFFGLTAFGGGIGASESTARAATSGGSGGGGSHGVSIDIGAAGTSLQGNKGGNASVGTLVGGGGGGAGSSAANVSAGAGATAGGAGLSSQITGSLVWYAGGGGGGRRSGTAVLGGIGGGGSGGSNTNGGNGVANTGGGGGGGGGAAARAGGTGGSGIVVVRYAGTSAAAEGGTVTSFTGNGSNGESGVVYQVHRFTTVGTNQTFAVNNLSAALTGNIAGSDNLTLAADMGKITLAGQSTLAGNTTITGGTVEVTGTLGHSSAASGSNPAVGSFAGTIANAGKLIINTAATQTLAGAISGAGSLVQAGSGTTILAANNTYNGTTTISGGMLQLGVGASGGSTGSAGSGNIIFAPAEGATPAPTPTLRVNRSNALSFAQNISGRGHLEQVGAGDITLAGYNTYSGDTLIDDGSLTVASTGRIGGVTGSSYAGDITVSAGASLINESSATQQWSGTVSSSGTFAHDGTGILALYGSNTFASDIAVNAGTLGAFSDDAFGTVQVDVTNAGLLLGAGVTLANNITLTGASTIETGRIVEYLIVGGGGGGGARHGGGGGAGGFIEGAYVTAGATYQISVGAGGAGTPKGGTTRGSQGSNSAAFGEIAVGGGGGGGRDAKDGQAGGSGGGGNTGGTTGAGGAGTVGQGFAGGASQGSHAPNYGGGGGGGASELGQGGSSAAGGKGGDGKQSAITGTLNWYAGGGGGSTYRGGAGGTGGLGGGGAGADGSAYVSAPDGIAGAVNTGGGGGGAADGGGGGAGGSGIVVVRYVGSAAGTGGTVSAGTGTASGHTLHTFTNTGTTSLALTAASATITGNITLVDAAAATFKTSGELVISGAITGGNTSSVDVQANTARQFTAGLTSTAQVIAANTTVEQALLRLDGAVLQGASIGAAVKNYSSTTVTRRAIDPATGLATVQLQVADGAFTKVAVVELAQSGSDVTAKIVRAAYTQDVNAIGDDFAGGFSNSTIANSATAGGYGVAELSFSGAVTLSGDNSAFTGSASVGKGVLTLDHAHALGADNAVALAAQGGLDVQRDVSIGSLASTLSAGMGGQALLANGTTLTVGDATNTTFHGTAFGQGALQKVGAGKLTLTRVNSFTGGTTVNAGTLALVDASGNDEGKGVLRGVLTVNADGIVELSGITAAFGWNENQRVTTLNINGGLAQALSAQHIWKMTGGVNFDGGGELRINGGTSSHNAANHWLWGATTVNVSNATGQASQAIVSGRVHLLPDAGAAGAPTLTLNVDNDTGLTTELLISATITQQALASVLKTGAGSVALTGDNTYTGDTSISGGKFMIDGAGRLNNGSYAGAITLSNNAIFHYSSTNNQTLSGDITGRGQVLKDETSTLTLSGYKTWSIDRTVGVAGATLSDLVIDGGIVTLQGISEFGANAFGGYVNSTAAGAGSTVEINNGARLNITSQRLDFNGTTFVFGVSGGGTLHNTSANFVNRSTTYKTLGGARNTISDSGGFYNLDVGDTTFDVARGTDADIDLMITAFMTNGGTVRKTGGGIVQYDRDMRYRGGTVVDEGTLILRHTRTDGHGVITGVLTVNQDGVVQLIGNDAALGWNADRITTLNINGGLVESLRSGRQHIWNMTGGLNFSGGGELKINGGTSSTTGDGWEWGGVNVTVSNPSAQAVISGRVHLRSDYGSPTFTVADGTISDELSITASITQASANLGLTKAGAGALALSGNNIYTGATNINAGTLRAGSTTGLSSSSAFVLANSAGVTLDVNNFNNTIGSLAGGGTTGGDVTLGSATLTTGNNNSSTTFAGIISGTGGLTKIGSGTMTLTGLSTYEGVTTISGSGSAISAAVLADGGQASNIGASTKAVGNLVLDNATLLYTGGSVSIDRGFTVAAGQPGRISVSNAATTLTLSGGTAATTGEFHKGGAGTLVLTGAQAYSGNTQVQGGVLRIGGAGTLSSGATTGTYAGNISITSGATLDISSTANHTLSGIVSGAGGLFVQSGTGTTTLTGDNTYTGLTTVSAGELKLTNQNDSARYSISAGAVLNYEIASATILDLPSTAYDGGGTLRKTGAGELRWGTGVGRFELGSGAWIDVQQGIFAVGHSSNEVFISSATVFNRSGINIEQGATFSNLNTPVRLDALTGNGTFSSGWANNTNIVDIGIDGGSGDFSGTLEDTNAGGGGGGKLSLAKWGSGTQTFSGTSTYAGDLFVRQGTVLVTGSVSGMRLVDVAGTGTGHLAARLVVEGSVQMGAGGTFAVGSSIAGTGQVMVGKAGGSANLSIGNLDASNNGAVYIGGKISNGGASGAGTLTINDGGTVTVGAAGRVVNSYDAAGIWLNPWGGSGALSSININAGGTLQTARSIRNGDSGRATQVNFDGGTLKAGANNVNLIVAANNLTVSLGTGDGYVDTNGYTADITAVISGTGDFTKIGEGRLNLLAHNTFTGDITVQAGPGSTISHLAIASGGSLNSTSTASRVYDKEITIQGATSIFEFDSTQNQTISGVISGDGRLVKWNTGTLTLTGANTYTGSTYLGAGVLSVADLDNGGQASNIGQSGNAASNLIFNGGTLRYTGSDVAIDRAFTLNAGSNGTIDVSTAGTTLTISGGTAATNGAFNKSGSGTLVLSGENLYTGTTRINAGVLELQGGLGTKNSPFSYSGAIENFGALVINRSAQQTLSGVISGSGTFEQAGSGTTILTNAGNSYTGATFVSGGKLMLDGAARLGSGSYAGAITLSNNAIFHYSSTNNQTLSGDITGRGQVLKDESSTLTLSGLKTWSIDRTVGVVGATLSDLVIDGGIVTLEGISEFGANAFGGYVDSTAAGAGSTVEINNGARLNITSQRLDFNGTTFVFGVSGGGTLHNTSSNFVNRSTTYKTLGGARNTISDSGGFYNLGDGTITFDVERGSDSAVDLMITAYMRNVAGVRKTGAGIMQFDRDMRYDGGTEVDEGTLILHKQGANGPGVITGVLTVNQDGVVQLIGGETALGWDTDRVTTLNINGGLVESLRNGRQYIWRMTGGVNFSGGGELRINGGTSAAAGPTTSTQHWEWGETNVTVTNPTAQAVISGQINLRADWNAQRTFTVDAKPSGASYSGPELLVSAGMTQSSGVSALTKAGAGVMMLAGNSLYSGVTAITGGTLRAGSTTGLSSSSAFVLANSAGVTLDVNNFNNTIGSLAGGGTTGGDVTLGSATLTTGNNNSSTTFAGIISGTGGLTKIGSGTMTLTGLSTYEGVTTISGAGSAISAAVLADGGQASNIGASTKAVGNLVLDNATLLYTGGTVSIDRGFTVAAGQPGRISVSNAATTLTLSGGTAATTGEFHKGGAGTLVLTGAQAYSGNTQVQGGVLRIGGAGTLSSSTTLGSYAGAIEVSTGALFELNSSAGHTLSGVISGAGGFTQSGTGTTILGARNTFRGNTTVSGGVLRIDTSGRLYTGYTAAATLLINSGGTLQVNKWQYGQDGGIGELAAAAARTQIANGTIEFIGAADDLNNGHGFTINAGGATLVNNTAYDWNAGSGTSIANGSSLTFAGSGDGSIRLSAPITGSGEVIKNGTHTAIIVAANTYTGKTTINAGTLQIGDGGTVGSLSNATDVLIESAGTLRYFRGDIAPTNVAVGHNVRGTGTLEFRSTGANGAGQYNFTGTNNLAATGTFILNKARLIVGTQANLGVNLPTVQVLDGSQLYVNRSVTLANKLVLGNGDGWKESNGNQFGLLHSNAHAAAGDVTFTGDIQLQGLATITPLGQR